MGRDERYPKRFDKEYCCLDNAVFYAERKALEEKFPVHWHEFYELEYILSGQAEHRVNGKKYHLCRGSMFILSPADLHEVIPAQEKLELFSLKFSDNLLSLQLRNQLFTKRDCLCVQLEETERGETEQEFGRLLREFTDRDFCCDMVIRGGVERLCIDVLRKAGTSEENNQSNAIQDALVYMQCHFKQPLTLAQVAGEVYLTPNYFSVKFRQAVGISFQSYLQRLRVSFAADLLRATALSNTEIGFEAGFHSAEHFSRVFKEHYGCTPGQYRKS